MDTEGHPSFGVKWDITVLKLKDMPLPHMSLLMPFGKSSQDIFQDEDHFHQEEPAIA